MDKYRKQKKITSYSIGSRRNTVYGLPIWLNNDNKPIPGREHNPDALIDKVPDDDAMSLDILVAAGLTKD